MPNNRFNKQVSPKGYKKGGSVRDTRKTEQMIGASISSKREKGRIKKKMGGSLKPVNPKTQKGLSKLPTEVRNKMGYMQEGGKVKDKPGKNLTFGKTYHPITELAMKNAMLASFKSGGKKGFSFGKISDELCFIKSMHTEAINHDPAVTFFQTGSQQPGRPSMGSWLSYGLGSLNKNLPSFVVLLSRGTGRPKGQPLYSRLWGNGFLSSLHQGVQFRSAKDPVLFLKDPESLSKSERRKMLDYLSELNEEQERKFGDKEVSNRISQYEMAYRMQTSVPETMDISDEPESILKLYGPNANKPGTYAANCILARKLIEKDVRFVQLYHMGWDQHENLPNQIKGQASDVDQPTAALIMDLKQRGLLEDTLVVWGGEFGRTAYSQGNISALKAGTYGRDHHPRSFTIFMAGAGVKPGFTYGETDDLGYNIVKDPVHVHDLQATILHLFGINHEKMIYKYQGRRFRLTDVFGDIKHDILT